MNEPTCTYHPRRETLLSCTDCERPMCAECLEPAAVGQRCRDCIRRRARAKSTVARELTAYSRALRRPGWVFLTLVAMFIALSVVLTQVKVGTNEVFDMPAWLVALGVIYVVLGWIISLSCHEWAHAYVAYRGGDLSVIGKGYLTLDPRKYTDPVLSVIIPVAFLAVGGMALPGGAVWIDRSAIRSRARDSLVSAAGPAMTILWAAGCLATARVLQPDDVDGELRVDAVMALGPILTFLGWLLVLIAALNLLPIPGLDGYGIIDPFLPEDIRRMGWQVAQYGLFILIALVLLTPLGPALFDLANTVVEWMGIDRLYLALGDTIGRPRLT